MKRITVILFSVFYLYISIGLAVNVHYCQGQVKDIWVILNQGSSCCDIGNNCCTEAETHEKCCDEQLFYFQIPSGQQQIKTNNTDYIFDQSVLQEISYFSYNILNVRKEVVSDIYSLQPPRKQSIRLLHCSFTYYG